MQRFALMLVLGCGPSAPVVTVAQRPPAVTEKPVNKTLLGGCRIVGTGERPSEGGSAPFEVFASNDAHTPAFVITRPEIARVVWSGFPQRADDRARVSLATQSVRYDGYAGLYGRTFTTKARMDSVAGHLWAVAGSPIEMMAATDGGEVFAHAPTPFAAPKTLVVRGNCADVVYEPNHAEHDARSPSALAVRRGGAFRLFDSPSSGRPFTTITPSTPIALEIRERRDDRVRVTGQAGYVAFDAWVLAAESEGGEGVRHTDVVAEPPVEEPRAHRIVPARVARDTPLYEGFDPEELRGALVERDAIVLYEPESSVMAFGHDLVAFELADHFIAALEGSHLWIAKDALMPMRH